MDDAEYLARTESAFDAVDAELKALRMEGHKCAKIATIAQHMAEGRDWWVGKLLEPIPDWPKETHCLHMKTPLKDVVFGINEWDARLFAALMKAIYGTVNQTWLERVTEGAKKAAIREAETDGR